MKLVLASASPRRRMLLGAIGIVPHDIRPADIDERPVPGEPALAHVRRLAAEKASAVDRAADEVVLAADTIVHLGDRVFGKPADAEDAAATLAALAGRAHSVTTAWCLHGPNPAAGAVTSTVHFRALQPAEIAAYVATGEGTDKAGGYGIQGLGAALVAHVDGDHSNVVGLPLAPVLAALRAAGIAPEHP
jgi:septum formation protein